jgi:hypothetical protein
MSLGINHFAPPGSGIQKTGEEAATRPIKRGYLVIRDATDPNQISRPTANNASGVVGVALYDAAGDLTEVEVGYNGIYPVKNTSGGAITKGAALVAHSSGGVKPAVATNLNIVGWAEEAANDGDLFSVRVDPYVNIATA